MFYVIRAMNKKVRIKLILLFGEIRERKGHWGKNLHSLHGIHNRSHFVHDSQDYTY
jgi:hypothetical protein